MRTYGLNFLSSLKNKIQMVLLSIKECWNSYTMNVLEIVNTNPSLVGNHMKIMKKKCWKLNLLKSFYDMAENYKDTTIA